MVKPPLTTMITALATLLMSISLTSAQEKFEIDNSHSSLIFSISHLKIGYIYGRFNKCAGQIAIDRDQPANSKFNFTISSDSIDTNNDARDKHLKGPDFFGVEQFPKIDFQSTSVTFKEGIYQVLGTMTIREVKKQITLPVQLVGVGKGPLGEIRAGMMAKFTLRRSDYGMDKMLDKIGDDVAVTFSFEAIQQ